MAKHKSGELRCPATALIYDLKKTLTPGVILTLPWGYIHAYYHFSQTSLLVYSQVSGERLQERWSSGTNFRSLFLMMLNLKFGFDWPRGFRGEDV